MTVHPRHRSVKAGLAYFAVVFAVGFVLGAVRTLVLEPAWGATAAVAAELPLMLAVSWIACGRIVRRFAVPSGGSARAVMGGVAFGLLMVAEVALVIALDGRTVGEHLAQYAHAPALLGLGGQVVFALMPLMHGPWREALVRARGR